MDKNDFLHNFVVAVVVVVENIVGIVVDDNHCPNQNY
jgi:hypothetical protein